MPSVTNPVANPPQERGAAARPLRALSSRPEPFWAPIVIRLATAADRRSIGILAQLDSAPPPAGEMLLGVLDDRVAVAASLRDGTVIADPFLPTADLLELVRLRANQLSPRSRRWRLR